MPDTSPWRVALNAILAAGAMLILLIAAFPVPASADSGIRFDFTISMTTIMTVIIMTGGGVAAWVTTQNQVRTNKNDIVKLERDLLALQERLKAANDRMEQIRYKSEHELSTFQIAAAKEFATSAAVTAVRMEVVDAIKALTSRFDQLIKDLHKIPS